MNPFKQLFSRRRLYTDFSDEIEAHLEEKIEESWYRMVCPGKRQLPLHEGNLGT
jgi:hypothetical protein